MPTDSERLDKLERILREGTLIWDGRGAFPGEGLPRLGLSLMCDQPGERSIREMIDAVNDPRGLGLDTEVLHSLLEACNMKGSELTDAEHCLALSLANVIRERRS